VQQRFDPSVSPFGNQGQSSFFGPGPRRRSANQDLLDALDTYRKKQETEQLAQQASRRMNESYTDVARRKEELARISTSAGGAQIDDPGWFTRFLDVLDVGRKHVAKPTISNMLAGISYIPGVDFKGEEAVREAFDINLFSSATREKQRKALEETELPWGVMGTAELLLDPVNYIPFGYGVKALKGVKQFAPMFKPITKIPKVGKKFQQDDPTPLLTSPRKLDVEDIDYNYIPKPSPIEEITDSTMHPNRLRVLAENLNKNSVVRRIIGYVNPSAAVMTGGGRLQIGWANLVAQGEAFAKSATEPFAMRGMPFTINDDGVMAGLNMQWADVFERIGVKEVRKKVKDQYGELAIDYIEAMGKGLLGMKERLKEAGIKVADLYPEGDTLKYFPRVVLSRPGWQRFTNSLTKSLGAKPGNLKGRLYDEMAVGVDAGTVYLNNPVAVYNTYMKAGYKMLADQQYFKGLKDGYWNDITKKGTMPIHEAIEKGYHTGPIAQTSTQRVDGMFPSLREQERGFRRTQKALMGYTETTPPEGVRFRSPKKGARPKPYTKDNFSTLIKNLIDRDMGQTPTIQAKIGIIYPEELSKWNRNGLLSADFRERLIRASRVDHKDQRNNLLRKLDSDVQSKFADLSGELGTLANQKRAGLREYTKVQKPMLGTRFFKKEDAEIFNSTQQRNRANGFLRAMETPGNVARLGMTGFDMGGSMIQGLALLAINMPAWARAQSQAVRALLDPKALMKYKVQHGSTVEELSRARVPMSQAEFVDAAMPGGQINTFLKKHALFRPLGIAAERAAAAFNAFGDAARVELWEAMMPSLARRAKAHNKYTTVKNIDTGLDEIIPTREALDELGSFVSKITGVTDVKPLGVDATQESMERLLFFAPRYYRAFAGVLTDVMQGDIRGELARDAVAKMLGVGVLLHSASAIALGQEPNLDPSKGNFLTVEVAGQNVGVGSIWVSAAKGTARLFNQVTTDDPQRPGKAIMSLDPNDSDLARIFRYRASPMLGYGWDVAVGRTVIGKPLDTPIQLTAGLARNFTPFWAQQFIPDFVDEAEVDGVRWKEPGFNLLGAASEFGGLRAFDVGTYQRLSQRREELARSVSPDMEWEDLSYNQRKAFEENNAILKDLTLQARAYGVERGDDFTKLTNEYYKARDKVRKGWVEDLELAQKEYADGMGTGNNFREKVKNAFAARRTLYDNLKNDGRYQAVRDYWEHEDRQDVTRNNEPISTDYVFDEYMQNIVGSDDLHDEYGNYDFDKAESIKDDMRNKYGALFDKALIRFQKSDVPFMAKQLQEGREIFEDYWQVGRTIANRAGVLDLYNEYKSLYGMARADELAKQYPQLKTIDRAVTDARKQMRRNMPALDGWLLKFGYTTTPENKIIKQIGKEAVQQWDFDPIFIFGMARS